MQNKNFRSINLAARFSAIVAIILPVACAIYYVNTYSVDVPYYDEWELVGMVGRWFNGTFTWQELLNHHNEHIILIPRIIVLANAYLANLNIRIEYFVNLAFIVGTALIIFLYYRMSISNWHDPLLILLVLFPIYACLFSLRQWESLIGFGLGAFSANFFFILSMFLLPHRGVLLVLSAAGAAGLSSLCFSNGLVAWPVGLIVLWLSKRGAERAWSITLWVAFAVLFIAVFLSDFYSEFALHSLEFTQVFLRMLAAVGATVATAPEVIAGSDTLQSSLDMAILSGSSLMIVSGVVLVKIIMSARLRKSAFALSLILFGWGSAAMLAIGRLDPIQSRYMSSTFIAVVGLTLLIADLCDSTEASAQSSPEMVPIFSGSWVRELQSALAAIVVFANVTALVVELPVGPFRRENLEQWAMHVLDYRNASDDDLRNPHFPPSDIREWAEILERHKLSVFRSGTPIRAVSD
jgi:hypothetical protein